MIDFDFYDMIITKNRGCGFVEYFKRLYKLGEWVKVLKICIALFSTVVVIDFIDLPSKIIIKYGFIPFLVILVAGCILVLISIFQNHILNSIKAKSINEFDVLIVYTIIFDIIYFVLILLTPPPHKLYKIIILSIIMVVSLAFFICRFCINKKSDINKTKNSNIFDLKDFLETDKIIRVNNHPILFEENDVDYDLFNRDIIINQLYTSIRACAGTDFSFVIGLEGAWGSGKTTVVNNVISKIEKNDSNSFIVIKDFDPWAYNNQKSLLISLFDNVLKRTGINYSASSLNTIVNMFFETIKNNNSIGNFIGSILLQNDSDDSIDKLKNRICDYLEQNDKTIVIFIDNLDRASSANIIFLLKIINIIFDLKRVVYVLSYDKARMNDLLYKNSNINEKFIEKVIQKEISITKLNRERIQLVVNDCITKLFDIYGVKKETYNDFIYITDYLSSKVSDIREFKRILNSVVIPILSIKRELYKPDIFALELIRFTNNDFYEEIYNNAKYYISFDFESNLDFYMISFQRKQFNQAGKMYFENVEDKYGKEILIFVSNIFPNVKKYLNDVDLRPEHETRDEYKKPSLNCGAASAKYFDLYFNLDENEYIIISKLYNSFIQLINDNTNEGCSYSVVEIFNDFFDEIPKEYHEEIINKLWLARNDFDVNLNYSVLIGLINNSEKISKGHSFFILSPYQRACAIMATLYSLLNEVEKQKIISCLKENIKLLELCSQIKYWLNSSSLYYDKKEADVSNFESLITEIYNSIITTPIDIYCDENYGIHNSWELLRTKRRVMGLDEEAAVEIVDYISKIMRPEYIYKILKDIIGTSSGTRGYGYSINENTLKSFFEDEDIVLHYLNEYPPTNDTEKFVCEVFYKYKFGEPDDLGEKVIYTNDYIDLF